MLLALVTITTTSSDVEPRHHDRRTPPTANVADERPEVEVRVRCSGMVDLRRQAAPVHGQQPERDGDDRPATAIFARGVSPSERSLTTFA